MRNMEDSHGACDDGVSEGRAGRGGNPGEEGGELGGGAERRKRHGHRRAAMVRRQGVVGYGRGGARGGPAKKSPRGYEVSVLGLN